MTVGIPGDRTILHYIRRQLFSALLLDAKGHALAVDTAMLQVDDHGGENSRRCSGREREQLHVIGTGEPLLFESRRVDGGNGSNPAQGDFIMRVSLSVGGPG